MLWFVIGGAISVVVVAWARRLQRETEEAAEERRERRRGRWRAYPPPERRD